METEQPKPQIDLRSDLSQFPDLQGPKRIQLIKIQAKVMESNTFAEVLPKIEEDMLEFLDSIRMTVYQIAQNGKEIVSKYKSGTELAEIRVAMSYSSIAGYVAMSQKPLIIPDVNNPASLSAIHPQLKFDNSFDKRSGFVSKSIMAAPIKVGVPLLGVLQAINKRGGGFFTEADLKNITYLSKIIGDKFHIELEGTNSPYEFLVKRGMVSVEKLEEFRKRMLKEKVSMNYFLVKELKIMPELVAASLEAYHHIPFMRYDSKIELPKKIMEKLNTSYLKRQRWVPIAGDINDEVVILIDDPSDTQRLMEIQRAIPAKKFIYRIGFEEEILKYLGAGSVSAFLLGLAEDMGKEQIEESDKKDEGTEAGEVSENENVVIQLVNRLIIEAQRAGASDIHIEPGKGSIPSKVRFRIDGACQDALEIPSTHIRAVISRIKIMSRLDISERRKPQDGKIVVKVNGQPLELRVATIPSVHGESAVMRVLAAGGALPFNKLNLSDRNASETDRLIRIPYGIFMVVGPTGSGKTTTLHAVLGRINTPERKIWTAEDPVEITQQGLVQVQMDAKIGFTFAVALRAFLRADPDVILIGEMRDHETAHAGIEASLTGHLVFSTLHTNSAPETITRLLDLGLDPMNFSDALLGVLAQRLVRTLCKDCKELYRPTEDEWKHLAHHYGENLFPELGVERETAVIYRAKQGGCGNCGKTGYRGRTGMHELLVNTEAMKRLIATGAKANAIRDLSIQEGMRTLLQDGIAKVLKGQTDMEQVFKVVSS